MTNKVIFTTKDKDGNDMELMVTRPSPKTESDADMIYAKEFRRLERNRDTYYIRAELPEIIRKRGLWNDDKQADLDKISEALSDGLKKIRAGGMTKLEGRKVALQVIRDRSQLIALRSEVNALDNMTCEALADNKRFDFLVSQCAKNPDTGELYFKDFEDYESRKSDDAAVDAARNLASMIYDVVAAYAELPEYRFLKKFEYVDDKLRLIDMDGNLCDEDFRRVDEEGYLINGDGKRVDVNGKLIDEGEDIGEFSDESVTDSPATTEEKTDDAAASGV